MAIRLATKKDAPIIALLGRITFSETFGHLFDDTADLAAYYERTFSVEKIERSFNNTNNLFWLAFVDHLPVGYAKLKLRSTSKFISSPHLCQLQKIYVLKDFLSMKIGLELQKKIITKAKNNKFDEIWLSVLKSNGRAIKFHEKNGFVKVGNHDFTIGKEHFKFMAMSKHLKQD